MKKLLVCLAAALSLWAWAAKCEETKVSSEGDLVCISIADDCRLDTDSYYFVFNRQELLCIQDGKGPLSDEEWIVFTFKVKGDDGKNEVCTRKLVISKGKRTVLIRKIVAALSAKKER